MPKIEEKKLIVEEIKQQLDQSMLVVFTDYRGLKVDEMTELRDKLRIPGVEVKVLKNTMLRFALEKSGYQQISSLVNGPNAVVFSQEDPVSPAKVLFDFAKTHKNLEVKMGLLQGQMISPAKVKILAELPSREILLATVLGTMQAPITSFVRVLNANLTGLVRALDQVREQKAS
ncbi:MAG TPA: 50S ribosomal protein L10 [Syntrophomonas sp.]|jgi:large subunit ribosomal protein L10|nr:50S ribosomal protein L10 [Syntrophomonas sp.]